MLFTGGYITTPSQQSHCIHNISDNRSQDSEQAVITTRTMSTEWTPSLWQDTFEDMLDDDQELDYEDQWTFNFNYSQTDEVTKDERRRGWKVYSHCAYGKFYCDSCSKTWPSARVVVLFRYRLRTDGARGTVIMRPFGQACRRCHDDDFLFPGFSKEEVEKTLLRLFAKIRKNCYGEEEDDDDDDGSVCSDKVRTKPHEETLCEACIQGICCQD
ncbi:receptor-transporting protein 3-like [Lampris incognitus]|uniref:receptor-transporting protein 3-like n=1 Tax=Lampris incognitus TaxID=2546036 RepID=UPI0024B51820|nr:receptor-transporting protein 3-like [Lampris incognitus]